MVGYSTAVSALQGLEVKISLKDGRDSFGNSFKAGSVIVSMEGEDGATYSFVKVHAHKLTEMLRDEAIADILFITKKKSAQTVRSSRKIKVRR